MPSYFARARPRRKAVRYSATPAVLRRLGIVAKLKRRLKTEEHDAQVDLFRDHIWPRLVDGAVAFAIGNGGKRHPKVAKAMKEEGVTAGVPDIFVIHRRQAYFLEMKKPKGCRVSKEQRIMMARLVGAGAICAVAAGLDAAIRQLEQWGLLKEVGAGPGRDRRRRIRPRSR
ncbi:MAG: VRR-NUC domain-containing protein [Rhizobiales bacterium]|nr:VRR-NUC domain-containing protein [Hyphomicrobiales bacterium]